ncbi:MAG: DUF4249 family protein [Bacteroidetes bacterium]|nr:DUF4249 family protein [Bacteroidota bacterium]
MRQKAIGYFFVLLAIISVDGCVEKLIIEEVGNSNLPLVISGFISDQPGPYRITVKRGFVTGIASSYQAPESVSTMILKDNLGNQEQLIEVNKGIYETTKNGIQGIVGRAYQLSIVTVDGKTYETTSDTLKPAGQLDSVYYKFRTFSELNGSKKYYFDIFFDAKGMLNSYFLWKFKGTFKVITNPIADKEEEPCGDIDCLGCSICNRVLKCTGYRNYGTPGNPIIKEYSPCTCCTCWYNIYNDGPILSDYQYVQSGGFVGIRAGIIPIDDWILQHKIYAEVSQYGISRQSYLFYKAIKDQQLGAASLFQPATGSIPHNIRQLSGAPEKILGLFYAASVRSSTIILTQQQVPFATYEFPKPEARAPRNCLKLYPNSTNVKPDFWED